MSNKETKNRYTLTRPLTEGKATTAAGKELEGDFDALEFRPMTVNDMLDLDGYSGDNNHALHLMHLLSGLDKIALKRMRPKDFIGASNAASAWIASEGNSDG